MNSPLPAYTEEPATETDEPINIYDIEQDNSAPAEPYPRRTGRGFATLPNVTLKQHRIAAIAGGAVTLFALGGFGVLLAFAPREESVSDVQMPAPQAAVAQADVRAFTAEKPAPIESTETIPIRPVKTVTIKPAGDVAAKADVLAGVAIAKAEPVPAAAAAEPELKLPAIAAPETPDQIAKSSVGALPATSPRWGNSTDASEEKAEALVEKIRTAALNPDSVRTPPGPAAAAGPAPDTAVTAPQAAAPAIEDEPAPPTEKPVAAVPAPQENATNPAPAEDIAKPDTATTAAIARPEPVSAATVRPGRVNKHVNLRSRPDDDAKVLRVVPAQASLSVIGCKSWCEVVYEGTRGYVYKGFVK